MPKCYRVGGRAFAYCSSLKTIVIPYGVESIGSTNHYWGVIEGAFCGCSSLESITIPDTVQTIDKGAFSACSSLMAFYGKFASEDNRCLIRKEIVNGVNNIERVNLVSFAPAGITEYTIPEGVTHIEDCTFEYCGFLNSIILPDTILYIGDASFSGCDKIESIHIPKSVKSIGFSAFSGCSSLKDVFIDGVNISIVKDDDVFSTFADCPNLSQKSLEMIESRCVKK